MATIAVFLALGGGAYGALNRTPDRKGVFHGCVDKKTGALRLVNSAKSCKNGKRQRAIAWNQKGTPGAKGNPGPATGAAGGDLTGNYPAPSIAAGAVGPSKIGTIPSVRAGNDANQSIANSTSTVLPFNNEVYDTEGLHSTSTSTELLTAPVSGVYSVSAYVLWDPNATGIRILAIKKVGVSTSFASSVVPGDATISIGQSVSTQLRLSAGESVVASVQQTSGGALSVQSVHLGATSPGFEMSWIAP